MAYDLDLANRSVNASGSGPPEQETGEASQGLRANNPSGSGPDRVMPTCTTARPTLKGRSSHMATVTGTIHAAPAEVFAVLSDGWLYSNWVVGTSHMRAVNADWPSVGARLHHASGAWPVVTRDESVVEEVEPDRRLVLTVKGWPLGEARVVLELQASGNDTVVTMVEAPIAGPGKWVHNPVNEAMLARRNRESLARLAAVVERRTEPDD
jgi:uncharacterized protein YndB with AHSA1/START domain